MCEGQRTPLAAAPQEPYRCSVEAASLTGLGTVMWLKLTGPVNLVALHFTVGVRLQQGK
jgi:hypothetical protein